VQSTILTVQKSDFYFLLPESLIFQFSDFMLDYKVQSLKIHLHKIN